MSSLTHGNDISAVEVTNISNHGVWLLAHDKELFMSYDDFPWFKDQVVKSIRLLMSNSGNFIHLI